MPQQLTDRRRRRRRIEDRTSTNAHRAWLGLVLVVSNRYLMSTGRLTVHTGGKSTLITTAQGNTVELAERIIQADLTMASGVG